MGTSKEKLMFAMIYTLYRECNSTVVRVVYYMVITIASGRIPGKLILKRNSLSTSLLSGFVSQN